MFMQFRSRANSFGLNCSPLCHRMLERARIAGRFVGSLRLRCWMAETHRFRMHIERIRADLPQRWCHLIDPLDECSSLKRAIWNSNLQWNSAMKCSLRESYRFSAESSSFILRTIRLDNRLEVAAESNFRISFTVQLSLGSHSVNFETARSVQFAFDRD